MSEIPKKERFDLKEMIKGKVKFEFYRDRTLYYKTENGITFPVPTEDCGTATFLAEDKAILFMRYMRRFINDVNEKS